MCSISPQPFPPTLLDISSNFRRTLFRQLENELRAHLAMKTSLLNDVYSPCSNEMLSEDGRGEPCEERFEERFKEQCEEWREEWRDECYSAKRVAREFPPEWLSWYPDEPEWMWKEMSWIQRHLVDVYAIYGALVMGVGLLMKLTWNRVW